MRLNDEARIGLIPETDRCVRWPGKPKSNGYGSVFVEGRPVGAHRWVYERLHGRLKPGVLVRHTCDNRICINPRHLIPGLPKDNTEDMMKRNRRGNASKRKCIHGHAFSEENTYTRPGNKGRACRICRRDRMSQWQKENREKVSANQRAYARRKRDALSHPGL